MRKDSFCKIATYQDVREFAQNVRADSLAAYGALAAYLLPVLYALLGAFAYNLRDFSERVKRRKGAALQPLALAPPAFPTWVLSRVSVTANE